MEAEQKRLRYLRDLLESEILASIPNARINGSIEERLPNIANISFPNHEGEELLYYLDSEGIAVSTGSACSSGDLDASHVLLAMGQTHTEARRAVRFSVGRGITDNEIRQVTKKIAAWAKPDDIIFA
jgi:cysteine desulfurase